MGRKAKTLTTAEALTGYDAQKARAYQRSQMLSQSGRDIGELPPVADPKRKKSCEKNFRKFCETYFCHIFNMGWSDDHLKVASKIEQAVLKGGLFALAMPRGSGKALALDTPLPTPDGWTTMGEVQEGDLLFDELGNPCRVLKKSEIFTDHDCYKVTFNDGEEIICDAGHLWQVEDIHGRKSPYVRTTEWLSTRYAVGNRGYHESRFRIPLQKPLNTDTKKPLSISPYALGVWLGDGACATGRITLCEKDFEEIAGYINSESGNDNITKANYGLGRGAVSGILTKNFSPNTSGQAKLRKLGILNNKSIPQEYLRASYPERLALLQGILDTDGSVDVSGHIEICIKYPEFAKTFGELLSSLGVRYGVHQKTVVLDGKEFGPYSRFNFIGYREQRLFRLKRKLSRLKPTPERVMKKSGVLSHTPCEVRTITSIIKVPTVPTQCVMVDSPSHLYLAGRRMVPTHNSSLCEAAGVWSIVYGHREFVTLVGATESAALEMMESVKTEIESNELLAEDFPEVCYPITQLEGIANRCAGQLYHGKRTKITWTANEIVLPTVEGSKASGMIIRVAGLTGRIRGMKYKRSDGRSVRPELVIVDDPQTSESANSIEQTRKRLRILSSDILGLAGPGKKISGLMPCTVIKTGDMADQILDKAKHPEWNGERCKMLYQEPVNTKMWEQYAEIRANSLREHGDISEATAFYKENRKAMDEGAVVAWRDRYNPDELSALQHAMNLKLTDELSFQAEYQNEPFCTDKQEDTILSVDEICSQLNGLKKGIVPLNCVRLTMFVDIQKPLLYWCVCAWSDDFTGAVIDYGAYPDQKRLRFSLNDAKPTLQDVFPNSGLEGQIYSGLTALFEAKMSEPYLREDGAEMRIERAMIDANWGMSTDTVYQFCRQTVFSGVILPGHGRFIGASSKPLSAYRRKPGERIGFNWMMPNVAGKRAIRHVIFDTNFWKSFVHSRLSVTMGDRGNLSLFGRNPLIHQVFAEHLTSEYRVKTEALGRVVDEWKIRPERGDNHWLDCLAGCAVCASIQGSELAENLHSVKKGSIRLSALKNTPAQPMTAEKPVEVQRSGPLRLSDLQRQKRG